MDQWRPEVRFYHGRRAFGVDAVRVYHGRRAFGVDEALSTSVWCRGACLSWWETAPEQPRKLISTLWGLFGVVWLPLALLLACSWLALARSSGVLVKLLF